MQLALAYGKDNNKDGSVPLLSSSPINQDPEAKTPYHDLDDFLSEELQVTRSECTTGDSKSLLKLFQQEMSGHAWFKWSWLDSVVEKNLQGLVTKPMDLDLEAKALCCERIKPAERSILLKSTWGLSKTYFMRDLVNGIDAGLSQPVRYFIYAMLFYRFMVLLPWGDTSFDEFHDIFSGSNQKGIESLVYVLSHLNANFLRLILASPFCRGLAQGVWGMRRACVDIEDYLVELNNAVDAHLDHPGGWWHDVVREEMPGLSHLIALSKKIGRFERLIRSDARISDKDRWELFELICRIAREGRKVPQHTALASIAKLSQGTGFKDLVVQKRYGYTSSQLALMLKIKASSLALLTELAQDPAQTRLVRLNCNFLLWWNGQSLSRPRSLFFSILKLAKLYLGIRLLISIMNSILEAIRCPDKPDFKLGFGYTSSATELTIPCYLQLVENVFRTIYLNDSVAELIQQTALFNLKGLSSLTLYYKNLTGSEMVQILQSVASRGAQLTELYIYDNFFNADMQALAYDYLNTSQIATIEVGCYTKDWGGGAGLTSAGLQYLTDVLPYTHIRYLYLCFPNVDNSGIIALADRLNQTRIDRFYLETADIDDSAGVVLTQAFAEMPLRRMNLVGSQIGDGTVQAFIPVLQNNSVLTEVWLDGSLITDAGASLLAQMFANFSLMLNTVGLLSSAITDAGLIALTPSLLSIPIQELVLETQSGEAGIIALANQLNRTAIWQLWLMGNSFTQNSMGLFASILPSTSISVLILNNNRLNNQTISSLATGLLTSLLSVLSIEQNDLSQSLPLLGPSIRYLDQLDVSYCQLTDASLVDFAPYLIGSQMTELDLYDNYIGDVGALALAQVLPHTSITFLDLSNNNITDIGAQALADVYSSTKLQVLYLYGNLISAAILNEVENFQWQVFCQDQLCFSNAQYNGQTVTSLGRKQHHFSPSRYNRHRRGASVIEEVELDQFIDSKREVKRLTRTIDFEASVVASSQSVSPSSRLIFSTGVLLTQAMTKPFSSASNHTLALPAPLSAIAESDDQGLVMPITIAVIAFFAITLLGALLCRARRIQAEAKTGLNRYHQFRHGSSGAMIELPSPEVAASSKLGKK